MFFQKLRLGFMLVASATAAFATQTFIQPASQVVQLGDIVTVGVNISDVTDLYAWQFDIGFDPTILSALSVTEGPFLATGGTTVFLAGTIDNVGGTITFNGDSLVGPIPGVTGSGELAEIQFQTLALGVSPVSLSNVFLLNSQPGLIDTTTADGSIEVAPEPSSVLLMTGGLTLLLLAARQRKNMRRTGTFAVLTLATLGGGLSRAGDIATAQVDAARTMSNPSEILLTTSNVNAAKFGKLFARTVDGAIYAQPLYLQGLTIAAKKTNVVYVVTSHNNVYAFDADNPAASSPIWTVNLGTFPVLSGWNTGAGVLSTPVIVRASNVMYVVAQTFESGARVYRLHALDILTGAEKFNGPVVISGSVPGTADDSVGGVLSFDPNQHVQRTGLAIAGNNVVFAFSADRDHLPYHGWVFSYNRTTLAQAGIFNDAPSNNTGTGENGVFGSGIWQAGRAPAVDAQGNVYYETGNGAFDGTANFGETFVKLAGSSALGLSDWFTPADWETLNALDYDLSSTGPTLIPGTSFFFGGAKSGLVYLMSTSNLGQLSTNNVNIVQSFTATSGCTIPLVDQGCAQIMGQVFWPTAPTPTLYVWGTQDVLRAYQFTGGVFNTTPVGLGSLSGNYPGGSMGLSSYLGTAGTGVLWAVTNDNPDNGFYFGPGLVTTGTLRAYDANNVSVELWNSGQNSVRDSLGALSTFGLPTTAGGKVYVPTFSNQLVVYGLLNGPVAGDVNGDSIANCADLSIVKAAYGKSSAQVGYDLRADINGDGVVNIIDLATVTRALPAGTVCQ